MQKTIRRSVVLFALVLVTMGASCAERAPDLSPADVLISQANEVVVALGTLQHTAIELNKVQQCDTAAPPVCHPLFSEANTRIVVEAVTDGLLTIRAVPSGWRATGLEAAARIEMRLDAAGKTKLAAYIAAARAVITALVGA